MPPPPFPDTPRGQPPTKFQLHNFAGINRNVPRSAIGDQQFYWLENLMPVANGALRAMYAEAATLFTSAKTIINVYFYVLGAQFSTGGTPFCIIFFNDGTATQVRTSDGTTTVVSNVANTFFNSVSDIFPPVAVQFNAQGIVITSNTSANAYWAWDGTTLTASGGVAPLWLTNGATTTMPSGVHGNAIEVYQNRVWVAAPQSGVAPLLTQSEILTSAPGNGADFLTADGAVITPQQDAYLRNLFNALRQANGYLYTLGDSSVGAIYNVTTGGSPVTTTFTNQNLDPQTGCTWLNTAQLLGQILVFANKQGVYAINGGIPVKVSYELDRIFAAATNFNNLLPNTVPTAAVAVIFGIKVYMILITAPDQAGASRNYLCVWDTKEWWIASQVNANLSQVYTQEFNGVMTAWGSDGTALFQLFQVPSTSLNKIMQTKLWAGGQSDDQYNVYKKVYRVHEQVINYDTNSFTITSTIDLDTGTSTAFSFSIGAGTAQPATTTTIVGSDVSCYGLLVGATQTMTGKDFAFADLSITYAADQTFVG